MLREKFYTYLSPAKLNLGLKIIGKRDDGYHLLKSVFCLINLFDEINIQTTNDGKISLIEHNQAWFYQTDLAYKAAVLLQGFANNPNLGANIKIKKTIPTGSGMGGGSSNAATVLMVLNKLWNINLNKDKLLTLGETLGADVPFFIFGQNALVTGIGENFEPVILPRMYFVIIKPSFHIPTKNIFANFNFNQSNTNFSYVNYDFLVKSKENDLLAIATKIYPQLKDIIDTLSSYGNVSMTGSGSGLYLTFDNKIDAINTEIVLKEQYETFLVESIDTSPITS